MNRSRVVDAMATVLAVALLTVGAVGCAGDAGPEPSEAASPAPSAGPGIVERAVAIAEAIEADPDATEEILASHGLDVEQFEAMLYEIGSDPELSKAYNAAME